MSKWNTSAIVKEMEGRAHDKLIIAGEIALTEIKKQLGEKGKGELKRSFNKRFIDPLTVRVFSNKVYAAIRNFGGYIRPLKAKALAIPIHPDAKKTAIPSGATVRSIFPDLVMIKRQGGNALLARKNGDNLEVMYVLKKSVYQKGSGYFTKGFNSAKPKIKRLFA